MRLLQSFCTILLVSVLPGIAWAALPEKLEPAQAPQQIASWVAYYGTEASGPRSLRNLQLAQMADPSNKAVLYELSKFNENTDSFYGDILAFLPDNVNANYKLARRLKADGFADLALPYYARAIAGGPTGTRVYEDAARNAYFAEDYRSCVTLYDEAIRRGAADSTEAQLKRGECHAYLREDSAARADFKAAVTAQAGLKWAYSVRMFDDGVFEGCRGSAISKTASGRRNFDAGKMYEAYRDATAALLCDGKDVAAQQLRLDIESRDPNLAEHHKVHAVRLDNQVKGGDVYAMRSMGASVPSVERFLAEGEALEPISTDAMIRSGYIGSRVILIDPSNPRARLLRARAYSNLKADKLAAQAWEDTGYALQSPDTAARAHHVRGILLVKYNDPKAGIAEFDQAIATDPTNPRFYYARASARIGLQDDRAALPDLDTAAKLAKGPLWTDIVLTRAMTKGRLKNTDAAIEDIYLILNRDPNNAQARVLEIKLLDEAGRSQDADNRHFNWLSTNEAAASTDPYLKTRSAFLAQMERRKAEIYEEATPDRINAYLNEFYDKRDDAMADWNRAVEARDIDKMKSCRNRIDNLIRSGETYPDSADGRRMEVRQRDGLAAAVERMRKYRSDMTTQINELAQIQEEEEDESASSENH